MVRRDPEFLRETCRKLLWSFTDESGGIGWSAPEMLGEIVSSDPKRFQDVIPLIAAAYEVDEDVFRAGVLYALSRVASMRRNWQRLIRRSLFSRLQTGIRWSRFAASDSSGCSGHG